MVSNDSLAMTFPSSKMGRVKLADDWISSRRFKMLTARNVWKFWNILDFFVFPIQNIWKWNQVQKCLQISTVSIPIFWKMSKNWFFKNEKTYFKIYHVTLSHAIRFEPEIRSFVTITFELSEIILNFLNMSSNGFGITCLTVVKLPFF